MTSMPWGPYEITVVLLVASVGLYMAWNIGANDVANALGTSVGSRALTLKQAIIVAAIFEFAGASLVGGHVTQTIRQGMLRTELLVVDPATVVYGMICALLAAAIWVQLATARGWPVSTTHAIVGGVVGFGLAAGGMAVVRWDKILDIALSWVVSPIAGGVVAYLTFALIRHRIMGSEHPLVSMKRWVPLFVVPIFYVLTLSLFYKGLKPLALNLSFGTISTYGLLVGLAAGLSTSLLLRGLRAGTEPTLREGLEIIEWKVFRYLQIITACFVAFAHGSNDVANAIGPVAAVVSVLQTGVVEGLPRATSWMLVLGGAGIVLGLATWGHRVIATVGTYITEITPSRGFAAEFGTALTIIVGSKLGLPLSTTHVLVGAVIGVGLARGIGAIDLGVVRGVVQSWVLTVPFCGCLSAGLYALARLVL